MATTRLTCPDCKSVLKPAKPVPDGKKVKCPKCGNLFTTPGLIEEEDGSPRKKAPRKEKAAIKKAGHDAPPPKRHADDDDDEGGGVYSYIPEPSDEAGDKPEINYAPDMSIKDLRGPAQAAVVAPSNYMILIGGLCCLSDIFIICFSFWPMVFSPTMLDHEEVLAKYYKDRGDKDAASKIKSIPKDRKDLKKEDLAYVEDQEANEYVWRFILMGTYIFMLIYNGVTIVGAVRMQNLESRGWGIAASIMTILPFGAAGLGGLIFGVFFYTIAAFLFDEFSTRFLYSMVVGVLIYIMAILVGVWSLRTLMSQEVIDGFEYVAE